MQIEFLGTAGAITTPRPGCECRVCVQAREKGIPYARGGPSLFVHGPDVMIDTPEEIKDELNRSRVTRVSSCIYSHWHPDHVMGRRVFESLNQDWRRWPPEKDLTDVYLPQKVAEGFRTRLGSWDHLAFMEHQGIVRLVVLRDGDAIELNGTRITPFRLAEDYVYAFLFEGDDKRVLVAPDELFRWEPPEWVTGLDLAVLPMGVVEHDPFTGERRIPAEHPVLKMEATFAQTLEIVERLRAERVILTHIEEMDGLSFDDLQRLERRLKTSGVAVEFAFDTMFVKV
ncbi:MAG: phosphoribosyl 1,2-cyclic phosphate phosphodiesterase [Thermomicrobiales bacterium]|jgi:phosphoribosyl 1,2-cyclic phosphate phosphodiesterase|nr:phosphoribosyl 1,2-cyclic phosphate phosphodiesterase [Thermomicrobiales bacterium]